MTDLILAIAHHGLVFGLVAVLAMEAALVRPGMTALQGAAVSRLDAGYGGLAGAILAIGVLRVWLGAKGWSWYESNPWFWSKMASFGAVGLLSVPPTLRFLRWSRMRKAEPEWTPDGREIAKVRRYLGLQAIGIALIVSFAAAMARFS